MEADPHGFTSGRRLGWDLRHFLVFLELAELKLIELAGTKFCDSLPDGENRVHDS